MEKYEGPAEVYVRGRLLVEAKSCRARTSNNNNKVYTMAKGLAGPSRGPIESEIQLESAIPKAGYERDWLGHLLAGDFLKVVIKTGGRRIEFNCWCEDQEIQNSTDAAAVENVTLMGGPPIPR